MPVAAAATRAGAGWPFLAEVDTGVTAGADALWPFMAGAAAGG
jgi:hypothetical protein